MGLFDVPPPAGLKPNLAGKFDAAKQKFPCFASYKLDGIRGLTTNGQVLSRTLKPIPNRFTQSRFSNFSGFDGEFCMGPPNAKNVMQVTSSAVSTYSGTPDVVFYVFDRWDMPNFTYEGRYAALCALSLPVGFVLLEQKLIHNLEELFAFQAEAIALGYEGIMTRDPKGKYKYGRSTTNEGGLIKVKTFEDSDAIVIGFQELMHNHNEIDEATFIRLGATKRSSHKEGKVGGDMLGALLCLTPEGVEFGVGTGFTQDQRREIWVNQDKYLNRTVKYKHFATGVKEAPRFPVFISWRPEFDL